jgi:hypothetical protein
MIEYEVVWNGSHKDVYLCVHPFTVRDLSYVQPSGNPESPWRKYENRGPLRDLLIQLAGQRDVWISGDLRKAARMDRGTFYCLLRDLERQKLVWHPKYGHVALRAVERRGSEAQR